MVNRAVTVTDSPDRAGWHWRGDCHGTGSGWHCQCRARASGSFRLATPGPIMISLVSSVGPSISNLNVTLAFDMEDVDIECSFDIMIEVHLDSCIDTDIG